MRTLIKTLFATSMVSSALFGFTAANAADAIDQIPEAPAAVEMTQPAGDWSGAYIGGAGDYNWGKFSGGGRNAKGMGGQVYGGYNMQSGQIVYGGEADIGYSGVDETKGGVRTKQGVHGSVRGRVGYDLNPVLVYGTAGLAIGKTKATDAISSDSRTGVGLTAGVGAEAMVTNNITTRVEYRYTDFQDKNFNLASGVASRGLNEHSVKVGVGVKF